jgi:hypothetical protein
VRKYRWESLEAAWVGAFWLFAAGDASPLTPYFCKTRRREYRARIRHRTQGNPWRWKPGFVVYVELYRSSSKGRTCKGWHLTRSTAHVLPSPLK